MSIAYLADFASEVSEAYLAIHILSMILIGLVDKFAFNFFFLDLDLCGLLI